MLDIKRRDFIALVGGGSLLLTANARRARAQQPAMPVVGVLRSGALTDTPDCLPQGLKEAGFVEGQNVAIEDRSETDRLPLLVADLPNRRQYSRGARGQGDDIDDTYHLCDRGKQHHQQEVA